MAKKTIITAFLAVALLAGPAVALANELPEPGMLPDSPFYFLKNWLEALGTLLTFDEAKKAERFLDLAERRLAEANALADKGKPEIAERAVERYREQLGRAMQKAEQAKARGVDTDELLERVSGRTLKHQEVLANVYEKAPEEAKEAIERAMESSLRGHEESLKAISQEKREEVMERMRNQREEAQQKMQKARERGIPVPEIPVLEDIKEKIEQDIIPEIPRDLPVEIEIPVELEDIKPETPGR